MTEYEFDLKIHGRQLTDEFVDEICNGPCSDCLISVRSGQLTLSFIRDADSMSEAINQAILDYHSTHAGEISA